MKPSRRTKSLGGAVIVILVLGAALAPGGAGAATIHVTTTQDHLDGAKCSLRDAIQSANTNSKSGDCAKGSGADTIVLPAGYYKLMNTEGTDEDANVDGDLDIDGGPVTIKGVGATKTIVDGNTQKTGERIFHVVNGDRAAFQNLTIRNGDGSDTSQGGAIFSDYGTGATKLSNVRLLANAGYYGGGVAMYGTGALKITNSLIADNDAADGYGGGIYSYQNEVTIKNTRVEGNTGDDGSGGMYLEDIVGGTLKNVKVTGNQSNGGAYGGGIYIYDVDEELTIDHSRIAANSIVYSSDYYGGGIYVADSDVTLRDSTVDGNFARAYGGGIYQNGGTLKVLSSTVSQNAATSYGGGIYQEAGDLEIANSTISRNTAYDYGGGIYADGTTADLNNVTIYRNQAYNDSDGVGFYESSAEVTFANSIIAKNRYEGDNEYYDCYGGTSAGNNLISDDGAGDCGTTGDDIVGDSTEPIDPRLGPLQDAGGPTMVHPLGQGSPALNAGGPDCEKKDQRHHDRANKCDLGAVEQ